jgi:hypothetical protein
METTMDGRAFLQSARALLALPSEPNWRTATGRAYYALIHEGRAALDRWGFPLPPRDNLHVFVRRRFAVGRNPDLVNVTMVIDDLSPWRNQTDYHLSHPGRFGDATVAHQAVNVAQTTIDLLDAIDADPVRQAAVIAAIRAVWP